MRRNLRCEREGEEDGERSGLQEIPEYVHYCVTTVCCNTLEIYIYMYIYTYITSFACIATQMSFTFDPRERSLLSVADDSSDGFRTIRESKKIGFHRIITESTRFLFEEPRDEICFDSKIYRVPKGHRTTCSNDKFLRSFEDDCFLCENVEASLISKL